MSDATEGVPNYSDGVVRLTGFTHADIQTHLAGEDEETARQFGWWPRASTEETTRRAYDEWAANWASNGPIQTFAVRSHATGELLGGCQLREQADGSGHVSYWTSAQHRGQGMAQRALRLLCHHADVEGVTGLEAEIAATNLASRAVAASAGFARRSTIAAEDTLMIHYRAGRAPRAGALS